MSKINLRTHGGDVHSGVFLFTAVALLICILLLSVVVAFSWASYIGVKRASLAIAGDRLALTYRTTEFIFAQSLNAGANSNPQHSQPASGQGISAIRRKRKQTQRRFQPCKNYKTDTQSLFVECWYRPACYSPGRPAGDRDKYGPKDSIVGSAGLSLIPAG